MKTALVTGSKGFIGKNLVNKLQDSSKYIIVEINEDIFDDESWYRALWETLVLNSPDVIFHVGACSNTLEKDVNYIMKLNFEFTKVLVDYTKHNKNCKIIYSSSAANFGDNSLHPSNLYGWSKYVAEQYVISNGGVALRYFNVYGPGEEEKGKMASIAYQSFLQSKKGKTPQLFQGKPQRDFVYVDDVISANLFAEKKYYSLKSNWYEVGSGNARSFEDVLELMGILYYYHEMSKIPKGYQFYTCSIKQNWMPGWKPEFNLEKGIKKYKDYLNL